MNRQVLIVGAGPTGLVLALWLTRAGISVRLIDKASQPGTTSRALVVQPRTLEFYEELGLADELIAGGVRFEALNLWVKGRHAGRVPLGDAGKGMSPFPYLLIYPQDEHERLLIAKLQDLGVSVERRIELVNFHETDRRVIARLRRADGSEEQCEADYIAGCDGAHSAVREVLNTGFPGGTYSHLFYVADVEAQGPVMNRELHVALDEADFLAVFPLIGEGHGRLIGTVKGDAGRGSKPPTWDDVSRGVINRLGITVRQVHWFSTYHVHHRVTQQFQARRAFLLGDAAHIHSPVGGQGMNTGIGDAVNLAWKLASVLRGEGDPALLDTYEPERIAFAERLVHTTDRVFTLVSSDGSIARFVRTRIVPHVLPALFALKAVRRFAFSTVSQTRINYRSSALSAGRVGHVKGGDRLPWLPVDGSRAGNFAPLADLRWQVHVYGDSADGLGTVCQKHGLPLHVFPWRSDAARAGLARNAAYLLRPDGYVALAAEAANAAVFETYLREHRLHA